MTEEEIEFKREMIMLLYRRDPLMEYVFNITHYTSPQGFKGIVESESLWATRYDCLNDITEREDAIFLYEKVVEELSKQDIFYEKFKNIKPCGRYEWLFYDTENHLTGSKAIEEPEVFVISFSKNPDSRSMWNYYSKNSKYNGFAMTFCKQEDLNYIDHGPDLIVQNINLLYDEEEKIEIIKKVLKEIRDKFIDSQFCLDYAREIVGHLLFKWQDLFKNHHFKHEEEHRLLIVQDKKKRRFPVKYREYGGLLIPYIEFPFKEYLRLAFVTCPPLHNDDKSKILTEEYLFSQGYGNVLVEKSTIPIRY